MHHLTICLLLSYRLYQICVTLLACDDFVTTFAPYAKIGGTCKRVVVNFPQPLHLVPKLVQPVKRVSASSPTPFKLYPETGTAKRGSPLSADYILCVYNGSIVSQCHCIKIRCKDGAKSFRCIPCNLCEWRFFWK